MGGRPVLEDCDYLFKMTPDDYRVFQRLLPAEDPLIAAQQLIDWKVFDSVLAKYYSPNRGRVGVPPRIMVGLLFLQYLHNLSDGEVMKRADTDLLYRWFLQIPMGYRLPDDSVLTKFRKRIGPVGVKEVLDQVGSQARQHGIVRDRLRLKDATHVLADIAVPSTLGLLSQLRSRLLRQYAVFDPAGADSLEQMVETMQSETKDQCDEVRMARRIAAIREILLHAEEISLPDEAEGTRPAEQARLAEAYTALQKTIAIARKVLGDNEQAKATRQVRSAVDDEALRGKHGEFYDGYLLDVMMDADSEIVTEVNVLPAGGNEALSGLEMVQREQETHGNQIDEFSIDGAGFVGEMLEGMAQLGVEVTVPPKPQQNAKQSEWFGPSDFEVIDDGAAVRCPAGEVSAYRTEGSKKNSVTYRFKRETCAGCPLQAACVKYLGKKSPFGRNVDKNRYEKRYTAARERARTERHAQTRRAHCAIERKLREMVGHHRCRRARYRGRLKVWMQACLTALAVNVKRMTRLLAAPMLQMT